MEHPAAPEYQQYCSGF